MFEVVWLPAKILATACTYRQPESKRCRNFWPKNRNLAPFEGSNKRCESHLKTARSRASKIATFNFCDKSHILAALSSNTKARVDKIIVEQLGVKPEDVKPESSLIDDLGADELDFVELVMAVEEEFDTEIPFDEAFKLKTVQDIYDYVASAQ